MGDSLVDKSAAHTLLWMGQFVVIEGRCHQALLRQSNCHTGCITSNPAAAPLLGYISGGTAGDVQNQVAGVCGHEHTASNYFVICLDNIYFVICKTSCSGIRPKICNLLIRKICYKSAIPNTIGRGVNPFAIG